MITDKNSQESLLQFHKANWLQTQLMMRQLTSELCPQQKTTVQPFTKKITHNYIKVISSHDQGEDNLSLVRDEFMAEELLPGTPETQLQATLEYSLSQSADLKEETPRLLTV